MVAPSAVPSLIARLSSKLVKLLKDVSGLLGAKTIGMLFIGMAAKEKHQDIGERTRKKARQLGKKLASNHSSEESAAAISFLHFPTAIGVSHAITLRISPDPGKIESVEALDIPALKRAFLGESLRQNISRPGKSNGAILVRRVRQRNEYLTPLLASLSIIHHKNLGHHSSPLCAEPDKFLLP